MVHETLEKLDDQIHIKFAHLGAGERHVEFQTRAATAINDNPRQSLVQRHIGMPIPHDAFFVANSLTKRLPEGDADVFNGVVRIDVQVTLGFDVEVNLTVPRNLVQHMLKEGYPRLQITLPRAIQAQFNRDLSFEGLAINRGLSDHRILLTHVVLSETHRLLQRALHLGAPLYRKSPLTSLRSFTTP